MLNCFIVGAGGFIGAVFRYLTGRILPLNESTLPVATLLVNVAGAVMIGMVISFAETRQGMNDGMTLFLKVGVCGGFTTFSAFALESFNLMHGDKGMTALVYITLSVVLCILGVYAGKLAAGYLGA